MAIVTTAQYKLFRSITVSTYDTLLGVLITAAQAMLERYCDRAFDSATYTAQAYDGNGSEWILLKNYPVSALTTIAFLNDNAVSSTVASTEYRLDANTGRVFRLGAQHGRIVWDDWGVQYPDFGVSPCWPCGFQNILVTYTAGYSSMPADLQMVMYLLVDQLFLPIKDGGRDLTLQSETLGDYSYTNAADAATRILHTSELISGLALQFRRVTS